MLQYQEHCGFPNLFAHPLVCLVLSAGKGSAAAFYGNSRLSKTRKKMNREYHKWYSPRLGRDMELLVFGHAGLPVLVFPTSGGRFYEFEDRGMVGALGGKI